MDVGAGQGLTLKGNQLVEKVERLIALAQMELQAFGIDVTVTGGGWPGIANYSLDFLEPMEESL
jgi:ribosomal protein S9